MWVSLRQPPTLQCSLGDVAVYPSALPVCETLEIGDYTKQIGEIALRLCPSVSYSMGLG